MGLDQYLTRQVWLGDYAGAARLDGVLRDRNGNELTHLGRPKTVSFEVAYWRKANQIHAWFVDNVQNGEDDCRPYDVTVDQLADLVGRCRTILAAKDAGVPASELERVALANLSPREGFFFGSYEIDDWYIENLRETVDQLTPLIEQAKNGQQVGYFEYQSSW